MQISTPSRGIKPLDPLSKQKLKDKKIEKLHSDSLDKYRVAKLEALKFKMHLQVKNLRLLTDHQDIMEDIYEQDRKQELMARGKNKIKRENRVFQTMQINRIEKDLEKTSRQLQQELGNLQDLGVTNKVLSEELLTEIDGLFDQA